MTRALLVALSAALIGSSAAAQSDCRPIGNYLHCFNPPPPQPLTEAQEAALIDAVIQQEREIFAPLAGGVSVSGCSSATASAQAENRFDLVKLIQAQCSAAAAAN